MVTCVCLQHVRLLQTFLLLHRLSQVKQKYEAAGYRCVVVCLGDFNAQPSSGAYGLLMRGCAPADLKDWAFGKSRDRERVL